jgi:hypothetical protein
MSSFLEDVVLFVACMVASACVGTAVLAFLLHLFSRRK